MEMTMNHEFWNFFVHVQVPIKRSEPEGVCQNELVHIGSSSDLVYRRTMITDGL
jgi:hypothetical protein